MKRGFALLDRSRYGHFLGNMELRHLRYFLAVAEELHFRRAAQRLHLAQPALSQQIKDLELELGTPLFHRSSRRVELTDAGRILLRDTRTILNQIATTVELVRATRNEEAGKIRIGFATSAGYTILPTILREFNAARPKVELQCFEMTATAQVEALRKGEIDIGLLRLPVDEKGILIHPLLSETMVMILPATHRLAGAASISLQDFASDRFLLFPRAKAPGAYDQIINTCRKAGFLPQILQESPDPQAILGMVAAGLGVSIGPVSLTKMQRADIVYKHLHPRFGKFELGLAVSDRASGGNLKVFVEQVQMISRVHKKALGKEKNSVKSLPDPETAPALPDPEASTISPDQTIDNGFLLPTRTPDPEWDQE